MSESFTLAITRNSCILQAEYFPAIELQPFKNYALDLIKLLTHNSIPKVDGQKSNIYVGDKVVEIPTGNYEIEDAEDYSESVLANRYYNI